MCGRAEACLVRPHSVSGGDVQGAGTTLRMPAAVNRVLIHGASSERPLRKITAGVKTGAVDAQPLSKSRRTSRSPVPQGAAEPSLREKPHRPAPNAGFGSIRAVNETEVLEIGFGESHTCEIQPLLYDRSPKLVADLPYVA